jgi:hypothetical protein
MKIKLELTADQEVGIVANSLQEAFDNTYGLNCERDVCELQEAIRVVFHYYTGEAIE